MNRTNKLSVARRWNEFWFIAMPASCVYVIRAAICLITVLYFFDCIGAAAIWFAEGKPASTENMAAFLRSSGLDTHARWSISPLFLVDTLLGSKAWVYTIYLIAGIALAIMAAIGKGGRSVGWILWIVFVGWANRLILLSGLVETLLSLSLFALAIAPPTDWKNFRNSASGRSYWSTGFAMKLMSLQFTVIAVLTTANMLAGNVWWNGEGAFALAAPFDDRLFPLGDAAQGGILTNSIVYESLTHAIVLLLPMGLFLAWKFPRQKWPYALIAVWCLIVAVLGSHALYAATFFVMSLPIFWVASNGQTLVREATP